MVRLETFGATVRSANFSRGVLVLDTFAPDAFVRSFLDFPEVEGGVGRAT